VDVEDGLSSTYPEPSKAFERLHEAFHEPGISRGGDRFVRRKISSCLDGAGLEIASVPVLPQAAHGPSRPGDLARSLCLDRLSGARGEIVNKQIMEPDEIDACLENLASPHTPPQCMIEAHLAVLVNR